MKRTKFKGVGIGDLLYSHVTESYCMVFEYKPDGKSEYPFILINLRTGEEIDSSMSLDDLFEGWGIEAKAKNEDLTLIY